MGTDTEDRTAGRDAAAAAALLPGTVFATDGDGRFTFVSDEWSALSGVGAAALGTRRWVDAVDPRDRERVATAWRRLVDGDETVSVDCRITGADGGGHRIRVVTRGQRDDQGRLRGVVASVTERSPVQLMELVERMTDVVVVIDASGTIVWANAASERALGHHRTEKVGTPVLDLVHPDDVGRASRSLRRSASEPRLAPMRLRVRCADDTYREVEVSATNLLEEPSVRGLVLVARDLSERRRLEARIHELEHSFAAAFRHSPVGRGLLDPTGHWLLVNEALAQLIGQPVTALVGTPGIDVVLPDDWARVRRELAVFAAGDADRATVDARFGRPDGGVVWARFTVWHVRDDAGATRYFATDVTDVTAQVTAAEERAAAEERLRVLLEHSSDLVIVLDAELRVRYVSAAAERVVGHTAAEMLGTIGTDLVHPDDLGRVAEEQAALLTEPGTTRTVICRIRHADGTYRWVEAVGQNMLDHPAVAGLVINSRDITDRVTGEETLREAQSRFAALVEHASEMITVNDLDGLVTYASPSSASVLGYGAGDLVGMQARDLMHPDDVDRIEQTAADRFAQGQAAAVEYRARHRDGSWRVIEAVITDLIDEPSVEGVVTNARDITERQLAQREAAALVEIIEATNELIVVSDPNGSIVKANRSARAFLGAREHQHVSALSSNATRDRLRTEIMPEVRRRGAWSGELELIDADGRAFPVTATVQAHRNADGTVARIATIAHDISELKAAQRRLEFEATHDALTGLPNRALFREIGDRALARAERTDEPPAVLFLDLDGFKLVNDSYGHDTGDIVLAMVARRLREAVRAGDVLARLGGDEFVILCEHPRGQHQMLELSNRIIETVSQSFAIDQHEVRVGLSIGIAFSHAEASINELVRDADIALYRAKHDGRGRAQIYDETLLPS